MSSEVQGTTTGPRPPVGADPAHGPGTGRAPRRAPENAQLARLVEGFNRSRHPDEIVRAMLDEGVTLLGGSTATVHVLADPGDDSGMRPRSSAPASRSS